MGIKYSYPLTNTGKLLHLRMYINRKKTYLVTPHWVSLKFTQEASHISCQPTCKLYFLNNHYCITRLSVLTLNSILAISTCRVSPLHEDLISTGCVTNPLSDASSKLQVHVNQKCCQIWLQIWLQSSQ